jgi:nucleotide-binding universal stress UspA family protein
MINKILVATDASAASSRAVSYAAKMSVVHEAELLILNVIRDMQLPEELRQAPEWRSGQQCRRIRQASQNRPDCRGHARPEQNQSSLDGQRVTQTRGYHRD